MKIKNDQMQKQYLVVEILFFSKPLPINIIIIHFLSLFKFFYLEGEIQNKSRIVL